MKDFFERPVAKDDWILVQGIVDWRRSFRFGKVTSINRHSINFKYMTTGNKRGYSSTCADRCVKIPKIKVPDKELNFLGG